jgi:hypothetical protein
MLLHALSVLVQLSIYARAGAIDVSCRCSSVIIPVHVDVLVPKDPTDKFGGLKSNFTSLRRVDETYNIYGIFCQPNIVAAQDAGALKSLDRAQCRF